MTKDLLNELFKYKNGKLFNRVTRGSNAIKDAEVGCPDGHGYLIVWVKGRSYRVHRLIYLYHHGRLDDELQIDHINGIRNDNRIENLRLVTHQHNQWNRKTAKGYYWSKQAKKWNAKIKVNSKNKNLGYFNTELEARAAYLVAKEKYHRINL